MILFVATSAAVLFSCAGGVGSPAGTVDRTATSIGSTTFSSSWNSHCISCDFATNENVTELTTLGDMYFGSDFEGDIAEMDLLISMDLGSPSGLSGAYWEALYIWYDDSGDEIHD
jgi:hypothetical protein